MFLRHLLTNVCKWYVEDLMVCQLSNVQRMTDFMLDAQLVPHGDNSRCPGRSQHFEPCLAHIAAQICEVVNILQDVPNKMMLLMFPLFIILNSLVFALLMFGPLLKAVVRGL